MRGEDLSAYRRGGPRIKFLAWLLNPWENTMKGAFLRILCPALACAMWLAPWARAQDEKAAAAGLTGAIAGKPFAPDQITLEGEKLTFRSGKDFFPDMEIALTLPDAASASDGKTHTLGGKGFLSRPSGSSGGRTAPCRRRTLCTGLNTPPPSVSSVAKGARWRGRLI